MDPNINAKTFFDDNLGISFSAGTANSSEIDSVTASSYLENAYRLNNEGLAASRSGDHAKAEKLHAEALNLKKVAEGENSIGCSLSANALGEEQIKLGKLDEAEKNLQYAVRIRNLKGSHFDAAVSRDNLGRVYEHKGEYAKAREIRMFKTDKMTCSYYYCKTNGCQKSDELKACSICRCTFYCSSDCQKKDWKARHKALCKK